MGDIEYEFLPEINCENTEEAINEVVGDSSCPCCGYITIPNKGDAMCFICPICMWEIDLFIAGDNEASDLNHGLTLKEARKNYKQFGAVLESLKKYCREPKDNEL